ncbi:putative DNA-binding protein [Burkholderia aenigmatica]|uniref:hypothetical protein n=1 Tax=Burkholderia aenigmatica TaxID=2015348 RepID=UPI0014544494|nr:hypothetical protein [Burkholderia aenigmatica]VWC75940.1 putative DNA-binding protein [Burkholderia aenigmatica]
MRVFNPAIRPERVEAAATGISTPEAASDVSRLVAELLRPYLSTEEAAAFLCRRPQTLRKAYSLTGTFLGVRPKKVGRRLLWSRQALMNVIEGDVGGVGRKSESALVATQAQAGIMANKQAIHAGVESDDGALVGKSAHALQLGETVTEAM